jgi:hypothetical protein
MLLLYKKLSLLILKPIIVLRIGLLIEYFLSPGGEFLKKLNCWEVKKCGREKGGVNAAELGVCTAAELSKAEGINGGKNGGRICWLIAGTLCGGKVQGSYAQKLSNCLKCEFYVKVKSEEGDSFKSAAQVIEKVA